MIVKIDRKWRESLWKTSKAKITLIISFYSPIFHFSMLIHHHVADKELEKAQKDDCGQTIPPSPPLK
jgi:hypothetical protein